MAARRRILTGAEVAAFITAIPNLAAEWRPPEKGGTRRFRADEIAKRIAEAFQEAQLTVMQDNTIRKGKSNGMD